MMIKIKMIGRSPLIMHNDQLADPLNEYTKQIAAFTGKKKNQTSDDRAQVAKLEWFGGIYLDSVTKQVVVPARNIIKCLRDGAAVTRQGKTVARALSPTALSFPLVYPDSNLPLGQLCERPEYSFRTLVKVGLSRISRVRPQFPQWQLISQFALLEDIMDLSTVDHIVSNSGLTTGIGDARILGYGRFSSSVTEVSLVKRAA